jgi:hypothetical protein
LEAEARERDTKPADVLSERIKSALQQRRNPAPFLRVMRISPQTTDASAEGEREVVSSVVPTKLDFSGMTYEQRCAARLAVLQGSFGIWKGEPGKPKDGLFYEQELRAEW